jgi:hypothetical protein
MRGLGDMSLDGLANTTATICSPKFFQGDKKHSLDVYNLPIGKENSVDGSLHSLDGDERTPLLHHFLHMFQVYVDWTL